MFDISQVGNRIDIHSDGVTFDITTTMLSGTSFVVANIEAEGYSWEVTSSGTVANIKLIAPSEIYIRGSQRGQFQNYDGGIWQNPMLGVSVSATGITGSSSLIFTKFSGAQSTSSNPIARNGQYIYFAHGINGTAYVDEVDIYTGATGTLMYETGGSLYLGNDWVSMGWLKDRKIALTDYAHPLHGSSVESQVWLLDFDDSSVTKILEIPWFVPDTEGDEQWIYQLTTVKDSTGDLHIICMGEIQVYTEEYGDWGYKTAIWDCNYSHGLSFDYSEVQADPSPYDVAWTGLQDNYDIVQNRYIVIYGNVMYNSGGYKLADCVTACVYDILSQTLDYYTIQYGNWDWPDHEFFHSVDQTNGKTYFYAYGYTN